MNRKSQASFFIITLFIFATIIAVATAMVPLLKELTEFTFTEGEFLLNESLLSIQEEKNETYKLAIINSITDSKNSITENIDTINQVSTYSWVLSLALISIVVFVIVKVSINQNQSNRGLV